MPPAASATIIVSPIAREIARRNAATMPDSAAGTTTFTETSKRVPPSANAPSRRLRGTARSASSDSEHTIGRIMMPMAMPAESAL